MSTSVSYAASGAAQGSPGRVNTVSRWSALSSSRKLSSRNGSPASSRSGIAVPDSSMPRQAVGANQSASVISLPSGVNQARSGRPPGVAARPEKNARRRSTGWARRSRTSRAVSSHSSRQSGSASSDQSTQLTSLSWQ